MDGQDFPGPEFDDGDAGSVGDSEDFLAAVAMPTPRWCMRPARRMLTVPPASTWS